jgi:hypothetical protein
MKKLLSVAVVLAALIACPAFAQSPGTYIYSATPSGSLVGTELWPIAAVGSGSGCSGGYCGFAATTAQIRAYVVPINLASDVSSILPGLYGGTGVNNGSSLFTIGGNVTFTGAFATTFTVSAPTNATLPAGTYTVGYLDLPPNAQTGSYQIALTDRGKQVDMNCGSVCTVTIPANSSVGFPAGSCVSFFAQPGSATVTIAITTDTLTFLPSLGTGSRTLVAGGLATACKYGSTLTAWFIGGNANLSDVVKLPAPQWADAGIADMKLAA